MYNTEAEVFYNFSFCNPRKIQSANFCLFDKPLPHPSRNMPVHDFIYMVDGKWSIGIGDETFTMRNDDVLILPANMSHFGIKLCAPKTRTMYFHIYPDRNDAVCEDREQVDGIVLCNYIKAVNTPNIKVLFQKIIQTQANEHISSAYIHTLLYELGELSQKTPQYSLANAIYNYILSSDKILGNYEIANHFCVSTKTAEVAFKREYHSTLHSFVIENKLKRSQQYLLDYPNMKMNSIAAMLGFCDEFHFSKAFKSTFGISPSEFRKQNRG